MAEPKQVPEGERPLDVPVSGRKRFPFYKTLDEARGDPDGVAILEGDWGGTVYMTVPLRHVPNATEADFNNLAEGLERIFWDCNFDGEGADGGQGVYYKGIPSNTGVTGGMGGGVVLDNVWINDQLGPACDDLVRKILGEVPMAPRFTHDCDECVYMATLEYRATVTEPNGKFRTVAPAQTDTLFDLYFCAKQPKPTVIARHGNAGPEYKSGLIAAEHDPELLLAKRMAVAKGFL